MWHKHKSSNSRVCVQTTHEPALFPIHASCADRCYWQKQKSSGGKKQAHLSGAIVSFQKTASVLYISSDEQLVKASIHNTALMRTDTNTHTHMQPLTLLGMFFLHRNLAP